jgi:DNA-binding HxlR family transcriptional regulator
MALVAARSYIVDTTSLATRCTSISIILYSARWRGESLSLRPSVSHSSAKVRLRRLVEAQILEHVLSTEQTHAYEYVLTEKGLDLFPVIVALLQWGDRWLAGPRRPELLLRHQLCGRLLKPSVICDVCGDPLRSVDVEYRLPHHRSRHTTVSTPSI